MTTVGPARFDLASHPHKATRLAFGEALLEVGRRDSRVVAACSDCYALLCLTDFGREFPDRAFNIGIAEQNLVGIAAGLASSGLIPYVGSLAPFLTMRAIEQMRTDVAYPGFNVKFAAVYGGITQGVGGSTHHATEDFAMLRSVANLTVMAPADATETYKATVAALDYPGPVYIRLGGRDAEPIVYQEEYSFAIGRAVTLREGDDLTIIGTGSMVMQALLAADALREEGIRARVLDMHTIKPIDREAIVKAARETGRIVTVEEHNVLGGLGSAVAEVVVAEQPVPMRILGIPDIFLTVGPTGQLRAKYGLSGEGIAESARSFLRGK